ncbi:C40 family peptidase [Tenacibaculum piscium]|uniref:C40 family peptidase n=1 Tax=Tenacibaculum piscium TaxID=1458515 RepID=UPI001F368A1C|nr:C40 family peptidase [Tenacibaculum piscium]
MMLQKLGFFLFLSFLFISCGTSKNISKYRKIKNSANSVIYIHKKINTKSGGKSPKKVSKKSTNNSKNTPSIADKIVWTAVSYKGAPYKFGGTTKRGMDCSGLIHTSFSFRKISMPRTSREMSRKGYDISLGKVKRGDLVFFKTSRRRAGINHVGLVTSVKRGDVRFIHASTSSGVIISSLRDSYWRKSFVKAKRVL